MTTRTPECHCLNCGAQLDAVTAAGHTNPPHAGALSVCLHCGAVMMLDRELQVRGVTEAEARAIAADPDLVRELARIVVCIRHTAAARN